MEYMKKGLFIFVAITVLIAVGFLYFQKSTVKNQSPKVLSEKKEPTTTPTIAPVDQKQSTVFKIDKTPIRVSWALANPEEVELYSNLIKQDLSEKIWANEECLILVNGGFYSKENNHLGLFIANYDIISEQIKSSTLNGFLSIKSKDVIIDSKFTENNPRIALQSGPMLMQNSLPLALEISNDEPNRRIVAGTTIDNKLIFLAVYRDGSIYQGPLLEQLPKIIDLFIQKTGIKIVNAINLDGGSASMFISQYERLDELTHVGSYFCIK
jgi:uncharacterized protein YigE (DUF2233 family)